MIASLPLTLSANPLIHWDFNEGAGTTLIDQAAADGAQNAEYIGGMGLDSVNWVESGGPDGSGYYDFSEVIEGEDFDEVFRTERLVEDPENPGTMINDDILSNGDPLPSFDLTMSIWFRTISPGARDFATFARGNNSSFRMSVVGRSGDEQPDNRYLQMYARNAGQELTFEAFDTVVNDGQWHHAAMTTERDEADPENPTETLKLYLDGELVTLSLLNFLEFNDGVTYPFDLGGTDIPLSGSFNAEIITVGGYGREGSTTQPQKDIREWVGDLDDLQLYGDSLGESDIAFLFANPGQTIGVTPLVGDYNSNGFVDAGDYTVWRDTLSAMGTGLAADGNQNNEIDPGDYDVWKMNFNNSASSRLGISAAITEPIPEPGTAALVAAGLLGIWLGPPCRSRDRSVFRSESGIPTSLLKTLGGES